MKFYKIFALVIIYVFSPLFLTVHAGESYFLPLFYIPKNVIYSNMATEDLPEILSLKSYDIRTAYYLDKLNNIPGINADSILLKVTPVGTVNKETIDNYWQRENINQSFDLQEPGSIFYNPMLFLEEFDGNKSGNDPETSLELRLNSATKRISEMEKYRVAHADQLQNYEKEMNIAFDDLEKIRTTKANKFSLWLGRFSETISNHRVRADNLFMSGGYSRAEEDYLRGLFSKYVKKIIYYEPPKDPLFQIYEFDIPKTGEYRIGSDLKFFNEGENLLKIPIATASENLIGAGLRINDYFSDSIYKISFDYLLGEGSGSLSVVEGELGSQFTKSLPSTGKKFEHVEFPFFSSSKAEKARISLRVGESKNLRVEKISQPEIMLENGAKREEPIPKITFRKINPTKYSLKIEGAINPYFLVFSESFHKDWKLYLSANDTIGNDIIASYFDGDIKEARHKNVFLNGGIFETWFRKPIAGNNHFMINGFANSWYITPGEANGARNYELIVEFWPQRLYYLGFIISGLTLFGCLVIVGTTLLRKNKK